MISGADFSRLLGALGLTQEEAATKLGKHRTTVIRWIEKAELKDPELLLIRAKIGDPAMLHNVAQRNKVPTNKKDDSGTDLFVAGNDMLKDYQRFYGLVVGSIDNHEKRLDTIDRSIKDLYKTIDKVFDVTSDLRKMDERLEQMILNRPKDK